VIRSVLLVLWMMSRLAIVGCMAMRAILGRILMSLNALLSFVALFQLDDVLPFSFSFLAG